MSPILTRRFSNVVAVAAVLLMAAAGLWGCGGMPEQAAPPAVAAAFASAPTVPESTPVSQAAPLPNPPVAPGADAPVAPGGVSAPGAAQPGADERPWPPLVTGVDLNAPEHRRSQAAALADGFPATLAKGLSRDALIDATVARHPDVQRAQSEVEALAAEHGQLAAVRRVLDQYRSFVQELDPRVGPRLPDAAGPDAYPLPGPEGLRARLIDQAVGIARAKRDGVLRRVVAQARSAFASAQYLDIRRRILAQHVSLTEAVREVQQTRFRAGRGTLAAVLALDTEIARLIDRRDDTERARQGVLGTLRALLAVPAGTALGPFTPPPAITALVKPPRADPVAWRRRLVEHPAVRALTLKSERLGTMVELVEVLARPDLDLDFSELPNALGERPRFRLQPRRMPPGPWFGLMEANRAELAHRQRAVIEARLAKLDALGAEVADHTERQRTAHAELELQADTLDRLVDQALETASAAFEAGGVDIDRVLGALRERLDTVIGAAAARRDLAIETAQLDALLGPR